ncbi:hypothetical protein [Rubellimicrobium arenae]|uniref:hypothetical protein n=1 Tax=Rubellimicrobium arenae TaxID=2817372 RepID=UPI001B314FC5|nr:hypothetical protein [Rubellimicrobium arenae]
MTRSRGSTLLTQEDIELNFRDALTLLRSVRRTLSDLLDRVSDDEPGLLKDIGLKQSELETALKRAFEAEEKYNAWHERHSGVTNACEIDFDTLREELACRLARLRECCEDA